MLTTPQANIAPKLPAVPPAPTPSRQRLRNASQAVAQAAADVQSASTLNDKAVAMLETAKADFQNAQGTQHSVIQWKLDVFKRGSSEAIPKDLKDARVVGLFASEELAHAESVAGAVANELAAAQRNLSAAQAEKLRAVDAVVGDECELIADSIHKLNAQKKHLREILRGNGAFLGVGANASPEQHRIATIAQRGLKLDEEYQLAYPKTAPGAVTYWSAFRASLLDDPEAPRTKPPATDKLWT